MEKANRRDRSLANDTRCAVESGGDGALGREKMMDDENTSTKRLEWGRASSPDSVTHKMPSPDGKAPARGREPGWCRPSRVAGKLSHERGMLSDSNVDGVRLSGFEKNVLTLRQWARMREDEEVEGEATRTSAGTMRAIRATSAVGLERVASVEKWRPGMMEAYLDAQFLRSIEQGKMVQCFTERGDAAWAVFHCNLLSRDEFSLFAVFSRDFAEEDADFFYADAGSPTQKKITSTKAQSHVSNVSLNAGIDDVRATVNGERWELCGFVDDIALRDPSQPWNAIEPILHIPPRATFVDDELDRLWLADNDDDVTLEIDAKFWASLEDNAAIFPKEFVDTSMRQQFSMNAVSRLARLVSYGYHVPVLRFARLQGQRGPGKIQMLLPFKCDPRSSGTQGAVVVDIIKSRRGGRMYRAVGIVTLQEAVLSARIVGPLSSHWLSAEEADLEATPTIAPTIVPPPPENMRSTILRYEEKPAYASIANKPAKEVTAKEVNTRAPSRRSSESPPLTFPPVDDWYKATIIETPRNLNNPKVNLKSLPLDFMQSVCKKLRIDDGILQLRDSPSENEYRVIQALSVEASSWVRGIMTGYGSVERVYVGVSRKVRCFFAVVSFDKWTDLDTRNAIVNGEAIEVNGFRCRERVIMRRSIHDRRDAT